MYDKVEKIGNSLIQHGKYNDRIYLLKLAKSDFPNIVCKLDEIALNNKYSKVIAKIPENSAQSFLDNGFSVEAKIPGLYSSKENALFLCKYYNPERKEQSVEIKNKIGLILATAKNKKIAKKTELMKSFSVKHLNNFHVKELSRLYKKVFATYPFPIHNPDYLLKTMSENIAYFGVFFDDKLVAASSAEMDVESENVEMTDFATDPSFTGNNFALVLLNEMEKEMIPRDITTFYTIARAQSFGMNITFHKNGYVYGGTLINNTNISGHIESMNIWYKPAEPRN